MYARETKLTLTFDPNFFRWTDCITTHFLYKTGLKDTEFCSEKLAEGRVRLQYLVLELQTRVLFLESVFDWISQNITASQQ